MISIAQLVFALATAALANPPPAPNPLTTDVTHRASGTDQAEGDDLLCGPACHASCEAELQACQARPYRPDNGCVDRYIACIAHG